jgi:hypothetical protein
MVRYVAWRFRDGLGPAGSALVPADGVVHMLYRLRVCVCVWGGGEGLQLSCSHVVAVKVCNKDIVAQPGGDDVGPRSKEQMNSKCHVASVISLVAALVPLGRQF